MIIPTGYFRMTSTIMDAMEQGRALRRAGKLVPPKLGPDGKPVERSPQEQKNEEIYQIETCWPNLEDPDCRLPQPGELEV